MIYDHAKRAKTILDDLIEYTGKPAQLVRQRCINARHEIAWHYLDYEDRPLDFYRSTDLYLFDLTMYQSKLVPTVNYMTEYAREYKMKRILDLGGGIGEYTIRMMQEADADVTYLDLKDSETAKYAQWRFKKHKVDPKVVGETYRWQHQKWDAVVAMDVLEHMEQDVADKALNAMRRNAKYVFCNQEKIQYGEEIPQHITKFTLEGFNKIDINLYKNART